MIKITNAEVDITERGVRIYDHDSTLVLVMVHAVEELPEESKDGEETMNEFLWTFTRLIREKYPSMTPRMTQNLQDVILQVIKEAERE